MSFNVLPFRQRLHLWTQIDILQNFFLREGVFLLRTTNPCRSQWPRGLRRRSAAARLLRSWVRIPPWAWTFVCCERCVLSGRGLCDEFITRPEESYRLWCVVVCDLETSWMRRPWPALDRSGVGVGESVLSVMAVVCVIRKGVSSLLDKGTNLNFSRVLAFCTRGLPVS